MIKAKTYLTIDTETCDFEGNIYDMGWTIHNKKGEIRSEFNALVLEIFSDPRKMMGAFYADKLFTHYVPMLERGEIVRLPWMDIIERLRSDIIDFDVDVICAYNIAFDLRVIAGTHKLLGDGSEVFNDSLDMLDIWLIACQTKLSQVTYKRIARAQDWVSDAGNLRTGAQYAYRFCSGDWGFIEDHTALSDARIETEILAECFRQKKRIPYNEVKDKYAKQPWRIPNTNLVSGV